MAARLLDRDRLDEQEGVIAMPRHRQPAREVPGAGIIGGKQPDQVAAHRLMPREIQQVSLADLERQRRVVQPRGALGTEARIVRDIGRGGRHHLQDAARPGAGDRLRVEIRFLPCQRIEQCRIDPEPLCRFQPRQRESLQIARPPIGPLRQSGKLRAEIGHPRAGSDGEHRPRQGRIAPRRRPQGAKLRFGAGGLPGLQQCQRPPSAGRFRQRRAACLGRRAVPGKAWGEAEGATRQQAMEGARLLCRLQHPGHVMLRAAGAHRRPRRPEGGRCTRGGRAALGPRRRLEIGQRHLIAAEPPGSQAGGEGRAAGLLPPTAGNLACHAEGGGILAPTEQREGDIGAQGGGIGRRHAAGAADLLQRAARVAAEGALPHIAVEGGVSAEASGGGLALLRDGLAILGQRGLLGGRRQGGALGRDPHQQRVDARRVRLIGVTGEPGAQFLGAWGGSLRTQPAIGEDRAIEPAIAQRLMLAQGGRLLPLCLELEDAGDARRIGRRKWPRQPCRPAGRRSRGGIGRGGLEGPLR